MKKIDEAIEFYLKLCEEGEKRGNLTSKKLNKEDIGKTGWHFGKHDAIILLAKIFEVSTNEIKFPQKYCERCNKKVPAKDYCKYCYKNLSNGKILKWEQKE